MVGYYARFDPDPESSRFFTSTFPDIPRGVSLFRAMLAEHMRREEAIPNSKSYRGSRYRLIFLPALEAAKIELYSVFRASGMRKSSLVRILRISKTNIDRLFALTRNSRLDRIEAAFAASGKRVEIAVRDVLNRRRLRCATILILCGWDSISAPVVRVRS